MTKQNELAVIDKAIAALGPDSYLGPWLTEVRAEVESVIRSDFFPDISLNSAVDRGNTLIARAKAEAAEIIAAAQRKAKSIEDSAQLHHDNVARAIREAMSALNRY